MTEHGENADRLGPYVLVLAQQVERIAAQNVELLRRVMKLERAAIDRAEGKP